MSNSPLVSYTRISPNKNSPRNHAIDTITIHCVVGYKALDPVSFADVSHQVKKRGERLFIDRVRVLCIGRDFDRDRSVPGQPIRRSRPTMGSQTRT